MSRKSSNRSATGAPDSAAGPRKANSKQQFWGDRLSEAPEMANIAYCAGRDVAPRPMADSVLVPFDCWQNRAHARMLQACKIIDRKTLDAIVSAVHQFEIQHAAGEYQLRPEKEDVHTNIEHFVTESVGPQVAGTMHTGRSRNDQTTTVVRLYVRDRLLKFGVALADLVEAILDLAEKNLDVPVAGFTHYQPASITTMGHWFASWAQALERDLDRIASSYVRLNISPLGAAASFGTSWPINREMTAKALGFREVQANSLDCITNRWEMEAEAAVAVEFALTHLSIVAQDIIMLSSPHVGILQIADRYVTGSSIMPQKRNPDFAEVTRAKTSLVQNLTASLFGIARGALSGYNRDTQWTKYLVMDIFDEVTAAPVIFRGVMETMKVDPEKARQTATSNFVNAVDVADVLAQESGLPFRTAYEIASKAVKACETEGSISTDVVRKLAAEYGGKKLKLDVGDPAVLAERKIHTGAPAKAAVESDIKTLRTAAQQRLKEWEGEMIRLKRLQAK